MIRQCLIFSCLESSSSPHTLHCWEPLVKNKYWKEISELAFSNYLEFIVTSWQIKSVMHLKNIFCIFISSLIVADDTESTRITSNWRNGFDKNNSTKILSRKKRFMYPVVNSPWRFDIRLLLGVPVEGQPNQLIAFIPFTWNLNTLA